MKEKQTQTSQNPKKGADGSEETNNYKKIRIKIFILESLREPVEDLKEMFSGLWKSIQKPKIWSYVGMILTLYYIVRQNRIGAVIMLVFTIIMDRYQKWVEGEFMRRYRERKYGKGYYKRN